MYLVFNLRFELTRPPSCGIIRIYGWDLLAGCHHPDKSGDHRHCECGDIFLICHMTICLKVIRIYG